jgi:hypothetical protein
MRSNDTEVPRGIITELREALDAVPVRPMSRVITSGSPRSCWSRWWSRCTSAYRPWTRGWRPWSPGIAEDWSPEIAEGRCLWGIPASQRMGHIPLD